MPEFYSSAANEACEGKDDFTSGYIQALYFTDSCDGYDPEAEENEGTFDVEDKLDVDTMMKIEEDCESFKIAAFHDLQRAYRFAWYCPRMAGQDFWLSRNGHGSGFFDRGPEKVFDNLQDAARLVGSCETYRSDNETICFG